MIKPILSWHYVAPVDPPSRRRLSDSSRHLPGLLRGLLAYVRGNRSKYTPSPGPGPRPPHFPRIEYTKSTL